MRVGIIGAGPAGLTAGYQLAKSVAEVVVFEAGPVVGGLSRSIELWNQRVDLGPHRFFSNDARVNRLWLEVVGRDYEMVNRLTRIYYDGRFYNYPLSAMNALKNMGLWRAAACVSSYLWAQWKDLVRPGEKADFESWVVSRFGRRLFEMFFKTYSEKLWGIKCRDLDSDFATQRIKKFSLGEAILSAVGMSRQKHKTLVDQFAYPAGGTGMVYERMAGAIQKHGGEVRLNAPVGRAIVEGNRVVGLELQDGQVESFDHVISTMPLTQLVRRLDGVPGEVLEAVAKLTFRNTIIIFLNVNNADLFEDQWLYIHSPNLHLGRLTNFRNWVAGLYGDQKSSILALEYWCESGDAVWTMADDALIDLGIREVVATGLVASGDVLGGHVCRIPRSYPVYKRGYKDQLAPIAAYLGSIDGLHAIGRYGSFKYNNQDHSILMGLMIADNLANQADHDLWDVNSDYENYQEAARIDETGLVAQPS